MSQITEITLALAFATAYIATVALFARHLSSVARQHARERELLLNQIMHLSGRTWVQPPAEQPEPTAAVEPDRYVSSGTQVTEDF